MKLDFNSPLLLDSLTFMKITQWISTMNLYDDNFRHGFLDFSMRFNWMEKLTVDNKNNKNVYESLRKMKSDCFQNTWNSRHL